MIVPMLSFAAIVTAVGVFFITKEHTKIWNTALVGGFLVAARNPSSISYEVSTLLLIVSAIYLVCKHTHQLSFRYWNTTPVLGLTAALAGAIVYADAHSEAYFLSAQGIVTLSLFTLFFAVVLDLIISAKKYIPVLTTRVEETIVFLSNTRNFIFVLLGFICLELAYVYVSYMGKLATHLSGIHPIRDQILLRLPYIDTSLIHIGVFDFFRDISFIGLIFFARYLPFLLISLTILVLLRSSTVAITNLGIPSGQPPVISPYTYGGDLFFSGHVAIPVLFGFVFWNRRYLKMLFFTAAGIFAAAALIGRFHYTIDVIAAPFFAYGVYRFVRFYFRELWEITHDGDRVFTK